MALPMIALEDSLRDDENEYALKCMNVYLWSHARNAFRIHSQLERVQVQNVASHMKKEI